VPEPADQARSRLLSAFEHVEQFAGGSIAEDEAYAASERLRVVDRRISKMQANYV
jgi:hypothetical protein